MTKTVNEYITEIQKSIDEQFLSENSMSKPSLEKISINVGCGAGAQKRYEQKDRELILKLLEKVTGQKPTMVASRKSISGFKLRAGDIVGIKVTLRGKKMYDFLFKFVFVSLPRTRDFRGISANHVDNHGNYSLGIKVATIFPEVGFDNDVNFGIQMNFTFKNLPPDRSADFVKLLKLPISTN